MLKKMNGLVYPANHEVDKITRKKNSTILLLPIKIKYIRLNIYCVMRGNKIYLVELTYANIVLAYNSL
jgi:hypothetical protein